MGAILHAVAVFLFANGVEGNVVATGEPGLGVGRRLDVQAGGGRGPGALMPFNDYWTWLRVCVAWPNTHEPG